MLDYKQYEGCIYFVLKKWGLPISFYDVALSALMKCCFTYDESNGNCKPTSYIIPGIEMAIGDTIEKDVRFHNNNRTNEFKNRHYLWYLIHYHELNKGMGNVVSEIEECIGNNNILAIDRTAVDDIYKEIEVSYFIDNVLSEPERTVVNMRMEGYNFQEIADVLGCSRQRVAQRMQKIQEKTLGYFGSHCSIGRKVQKYARK